MESLWAHIEGGIVTSVEVVEDSFVLANPVRYSPSEWIKVGEGTINPECSISDIYILKNGRTVRPAPFKSWTLDEDKCEWVCPKPQPAEDYYWNEAKQIWIEAPVK